MIRNRLAIFNWIKIHEIYFCFYSLAYVVLLSITLQGENFIFGFPSFDSLSTDTHVSMGYYQHH